MGERRDSYFGRRKGKRLRPGQKSRLDRLLPALRLDLDQPAPERLVELFSVPVEATALEIGFGGGERLVAEALAAPRTGMIGAEIFQTGLAKALRAIEESGVGNIRLHDGDAGPLLDWLPAGSLARIDLYYPDPWPKRRHWKRRFVGPDNLRRMARALGEGGQLRFVSDIADYVDWTLKYVRADPELEWQAQGADDWRRAWPGWTTTRYEAKAISAGRKPVYLSFCKIRRGD